MREGSSHPGTDGRLAGPSLAKLTRPRLHGAYSRPRVLRVLDGMLDRAAVWIGAAPGSGKTVLASTWVESRKCKCLWYRADRRDRYPATLFHYLRLAAQTAGLTDAQSLPRLEPGHAPCLDAFARNFFEQFFACFQPGDVLVIDDCHELGDDPEGTALIATALEYAPAPPRIILISRRSPGPAFARACASESLRTLPEAVLALDMEEAHRIARARFGPRVDSACVEAIHRNTRGWAAGFTLLLEHALGADRGPIATHESVSAYFAAEVLADLDAATMDILMKSAWLPRVSARALRELCADPHAADHVAALCRRNYFVTANESGPPVYEYHPLLRQSLQQQARNRWPPAELDGLRTRVAQLLIRDGCTEDALDLLLDAGDWERAGRLLEEHAPAWLRVGRREIVATAIAALPQPEVAARPALLYLQATCRLTRDLPCARRLLEAAVQGFEAAGDVAGQLRACIAIVESHFHERTDFRRLDPWIERVERLLAMDPRWLDDPDCAAPVTAAMFCAYVVRLPGHPALERWMMHAEAMVAHGDDGAARLGVATQLVAFHAWWTGDSTRAGMVFDAIEPTHGDVGAHPLARIAWNAAGAIHRACVLDFAGSVTCAQRGLRVAAQSGIHSWDFLLLAQCGWGAIFQQDHAEAGRVLERMAGILEAGRHLDACQYHFQNFILALRRDDLPVMAVHADATWEYARASGNPWAEALALVARARVTDDPRAAHELLLDAQARIEGEPGNTTRYAVLLARAEQACRPSDPEAGLPQLAEFMAFARQKHIVHSFWDRDAVMAQLCVRALQHGIESGFVARLVRMRHLIPQVPPVHVPGWPWQLDIDTLGHFEVRVDGLPLRFDGKSRKRPLALLKALLAFGGKAVSETRLTDALWPDADGDAAQQALATTLHRLRQLVGAGCILRQGGMMDVDPARCRVDIWTVAQDLDEVERMLPGDVVGALAALQRAAAVYDGAFLDGDPDAEWAVLMRERLRNRMLRDVTVTAGALHGSGAAAAAIECYERGLGIDPLAEECYRGLMSCHLDHGHPAAGLAVYHRCRQALATGLGIEPSADVEILRAALERPRARGRSASHVRSVPDR